jgi:hypothetical protein
MKHHYGGEFDAKIEKLNGVLRILPNMGMKRIEKLQKVINFSKYTFCKLTAEELRDIFTQVSAALPVLGSPARPLISVVARYARHVRNSRAPVLSTAMLQAWDWYIDTYDESLDTMRELPPKNIWTHCINEHMILHVS